jgi:hypothetical protein
MLARWCRAERKDVWLRLDIEQTWRVARIEEICCTHRVCLGEAPEVVGLPWAKVSSFCRIKVQLSCCVSINPLESYRVVWGDSFGGVRDGRRRRQDVDKLSAVRKEVTNVQQLYTLQLFRRSRYAGCWRRKSTCAHCAGGLDILSAPWYLISNRSIPPRHHFGRTGPSFTVKVAGHLSIASSSTMTRSREYPSLVCSLGLHPHARH